MLSFQNLVIFFTIYSFIGWILETIYASYVDKKFVNRGFLNGFFCPIYGFGMLIVIIVSEISIRNFNGFYECMIVTILAATFLVTVLEYLTGYILEKIFKTRWWDYSDSPFNINGYVRLENMFIWAVLIFIVNQFVHPKIARFVFIISHDTKKYLALLIILFFIGDTIKAIISTLDLRVTIMNYASLPIEKYKNKIFKHRRVFIAFPRLQALNRELKEHHVKEVLNEKINKVKDKVKDKIK